MAETKEEKQRPKWQRFLLCCLTSPINTLFVLALLYFGFRGFVWGGAVADKTAVFAVLALWAFYLLAKKAFKIILIIILLLCGGYGYYHYTHLEESQCEQSGGVWNSKKRVCEEKIGLWKRIQKMWSEYAAAKPEPKKITK